MSTKKQFFISTLIGLVAILALFFSHTSYAQTKTCVKDADCGSTQRCAAGSCVEFVQENPVTGNFVPLTQLPQIQDASKSDTLPVFFNSLYKILIGVAATLAVIMIMYGGVQYMTSQGSVSSNEKAKKNIQNAILGLILVLSPTIVFGIINPDILNLNLNFGGLQRNDVPSDTQDPGSIGAVQLWQSSGNLSNDTSRCNSDGGTLIYTCVKKSGGDSRQVAKTDTCSSDETKINVCNASTAVQATANSCSTSYTNPNAYSTENGASCSALHLTAVPHTCCGGANTTNTICCALPKNGGEYLLAYYFTKTNTETKYKCYVDFVRLSPTLQDCTNILEQEKTIYAGSSREGQTVEKITVVKSCEVATNNSYTVPPPDNLPRCPN